MDGRARQLRLYIITRDRVTYTRKVVDWFAGRAEITIVDNASTYPPMMEYLDSATCDVIQLAENRGHMVPWQLGLVPQRAYYAVTDCDVLPVEGCPDDVLDHLRRQLAKPIMAGRSKAGVSLSLDGVTAERVLRVEGRYFSPLDDELYDAPVDTTLAVYRPGCTFRVDGARSREPYTAYHLPWHDIVNPDEHKYYLAHMRRDSVYYSRLGIR